MDFQEKRGLELAPQGFRPWFEHEHAQSAGITDRLRPLVDARFAALSERADARLGLPVGRHADGDQARGSSRLSGAEPRAVASQNRSDSFLGGARELAPVSRACRRAPASRCISATSLRSPVTFQNEAMKLVSPT